MNQPHRLVQILEGFRDHGDRASLAALRRGLGQPPGAVPETSRVVEHMLDEDDWDSTRDSLYIVAPLFALHPSSESGNRWTSNMGSHFHSVIGDSTDPPANVERRFMALLASEPDDLTDALRQAISLLKSSDVPVNWRSLLEDIQNWLDPTSEGESKRRKVRLRWSKSFWRLPTSPAVSINVHS